MIERNPMMNTKKLVSGCMAVLLLASNVIGVSVQTKAGRRQQPAYSDMEQSVKNLNSTQDKVQTDFYQLDRLSANIKKLSLKGATDTASYLLSDSEWAQSGSDYYFSKLNTAQKELYLKLKTQADMYLTGIEDFQTLMISRDGQDVMVYTMPMISYQGLATAQMKQVFTCFFFENPQYYFMRNSVIYSESTQTMTVGLYDIFANGIARQGYTEQFAQQLSVWEQQIALMGTTVEKEQLINQLLCDYVTYDYEMVTDDPDDSQMSQSCISAVLFERATVCTGYAQLFALLCNRAGIECVTITSDHHAWNKVRMGNTWYNVDCTWNDSRGDEAFLNVTDRQLQAEDTQAKEHTLSAEWQDFAPLCDTVFDLETANGEDAGTNLPALEKMTDITAVSTEKGKVLVSFSPITGCDGYALQYATNAAMNAAKKKAVAQPAYEITGIASGKVCYVKVRAYVLDCNGGKVYGAYSKKVKVTVM